MELPIKVEGILYAKINHQYKFLIIKRCPEDGGFWQPLTGTAEDGEKLIDCLKREILEEIGVKEINNITNEIYRFDWKNKKNETIIEIVYGVELPINSEIILSPEHVDYKWCTFDEAINLLEKENNKKSFSVFYQTL